MHDVIVIYQMPNRTVAVKMPECAVADAKRNGREDNMPVVAVVRPKLNRDHSAPDVMRAWYLPRRLDILR